MPKQLRRKDARWGIGAGGEVILGVESGLLGREPGGKELNRGKRATGESSSAQEGARPERELIVEEVDGEGGLRGEKLPVRRRLR
jgi:hypothetical protein